MSDDEKRAEAEPSAPAPEAPASAPHAEPNASAEAAPKLDPLIPKRAPPSSLVRTLPRTPERAPAARAPVTSAGALALGDEGPFLGDVGRGVVGAAVAGLVAHTLFGGIGVGRSAWTIGIVLIGALAAIGGRDGLTRGIQGGLWGLLGGLMYAQSLPSWPLLGALLAGAAAAPVLARGEPSGKLAATGLLTGVLALFGAYVTTQLGGGALETLVPPFLASSIAGGALGLFVGLGALPRHLGRGEEPVEAAYAKALASAQGEVSEILGRSLDIYRAIREDLASRQGNRTEAQLTTRVSDLALRILKIGESCRAIERDLGAAPAEALEERIEGLRKKAEAASDPAAKATFLSTIDSLDQQKKAIEAIGRGLERVVARLHANVALLEKVRFSLVHARSADAERSGSEASPLTETIDELSRELDATSTAVGEVYGKPGP